MQTPLMALGLATLLASSALTQTTALPKQRSILRPSLPFQFAAEELAQRMAFDEGHHLIVKFAEGVRVRLTDECLRAEVDLSRVTATIAGSRVERLFTRSVEDLDTERAQLQSQVPVDEVPLADLNNYYRIITASPQATEELINRLNHLPLVETAYPEPLLVSTCHGDLLPLTPDFTPAQLALAYSATGLGYYAIRSIVGARFPDNKIAHLEGAWTLDHEDLHLGPQSLLGKPPAPPWNTRAWTDHGNACMGIFAAERNGYGVEGFASAARTRYVVSMTNGAANMVSLATAKLDPGDVMTSSVSPWIHITVGSQTAVFQVPLDLNQAAYDAIRTASAKGIFYTLSGGNQHSDLDNTLVYGTRYHASSASSGAFIIAATGLAHQAKAPWSVYGQRIDANGLGNLVTTAGYGDLFLPNGDHRQDYTVNFGGTSAAAAMVAGSIASIVGAAREQLGRRLGLSEVRTALHTIGTQIPGPNPIGLRPDLVKLFLHFRILDGLLVTRDGTAGGTFEFKVSGQNGDLWHTLISPGRGRTKVGLNRPILLDTNLLLSLAQGTFTASGVETQTLKIPNLPTLVDVDVYLQTLVVHMGSLRLSNSAELWIQ